MALDVIGLSLSNSYTDETVEGAGAIKGKNCVVDDISKSGKKNTVRFKWTLDDGTVLTGNMEVMDGEDGAPGQPGQPGADGQDGDPGPAGKGIASIEQITGESQIIITYDDGTTSDPIDIPTVAGQPGKDGKDGQDGTDGTDGTDGVSPSVVVKTSTGESYILTITDATGSYDTPNLKGADGQDGQDGTDGIGVPTGGTTGQVLKKKSGTDYDTEWGDAGSGGTSDYTDLTNKPQINSVTLSGNKSLSDLGIIGTSLTAGLVKNDGTIDTTQYLSQHQDISGKADKVSVFIENNFAALDSNGNLKDSGNKASDFLTSHQDISGKADKVSGATNGNFAALDNNGNLTDSGKKDSDFAVAAQAVPTGGTTGQVLAKKSNTDNDTEWVNAGGGSGGHTIVNQSGTSMTARSNLQFIDATPIDDSTNNVTKIEVVKEITKSQLASMPDGIYRTTDEPDYPGGGSSSHDYSTTEHEVGTWIDGSTLYERTLELTTPTVGSETNVAVQGFSGVDKIFLCDISYLVLLIGGKYQYVPITTSWGTTGIGAVPCTDDSNNVSIQWQVSISEWLNKPCCLTVRYTKTTT